ncbi:MAG: hypothetical protein GY868_01290 [Deltaproteobacteria bacterium]|nr:hypothetical protein [Deltaproteobacteria bacterium]
MNILICIDDTDNIDSRGTGELAELLAGDIEKKGWGTCSPITRHQMLIHPDIAYTSHNSAMCFAADIDPAQLSALIRYAQEFLVAESASGSDPGLCVVTLDTLSLEDDLIAFGRKAKQQVIQKEEAYGLAERLGVHLSEHGGTGIGVIGALAGTGLRLTRNDGRFKGKLKISASGEAVTVKKILQQTYVETVQSLDGSVLEADDLVHPGSKVKAVLLEGRATMLVYADADIGADRTIWRTCTKQQLRKF